MGFSKFLEAVSVPKGERRGGGPRGRAQHRLLPGAVLPLLSRCSRLAAAPSRVFSAAGSHGLRRVQGHERRAEKPAGGYAAPGNTQAGGGTGRCPAARCPHRAGPAASPAELCSPPTVKVLRQFLCGYLAQQIQVCTAPVLGVKGLPQQSVLTNCRSGNCPYSSQTL